MTQELGNFIDCKLLEVYNIKSGRKLEYYSMKEDLLGWYKKQKLGGKSYWRKEFQSAKPKGEEAYDMYRLCLVESAKLVYPDSRRSEGARQIRAHFLNTIDSSISQRIADAELAYRLNPAATAKYMPFSSIVDMATELQKASSVPLAKLQNVM